MKRVVNYLVFVFIIFSIFIYKVNADCSYQERKDLLNATKKVDISYEAIENENNGYNFKFNIVGLTDKIFFKYYNTNNGEENFIHYSDTDNGVYSFIDQNTYMIYDYAFIFYSSNDNCVGYEITSKKVKKPMYNLYSSTEMCGYEDLKNFKYCKKFTTTDFKLTKEKFNEAVTNYLNKQQENSAKETTTTQKKNFIEKYYLYIIIGVVVLGIAVFIFIKIRKKKIEL